MADLSETMQVVVTQETKTVAKKNFGVILIAGPNVNSSDRTVTISSLAEARAYLNGGSVSPEYIKVRDAFSQQNAPATLKLGVMSNTGVTVITDNAGGFSAGSISALFYVNGGTTAVAVTTAWATDKDTTLDAFADALQAAIRTAIGSDTASTAVYSNSTHTITITPKTGNRVTVAATLVASGSGDTCTITSALAPTGGTLEAYDVALENIQLSDDDWYHLLIASSLKADVKLAAAFAEASRSPKIFTTASSDSDIVDVAPGSDSSTTGTIAAQLKGLARSRTEGFYSATAGTDSAAATQSLDAAAVAIYTSFTPGKFNPAYKTPSGITPDQLTTQQELYSRGRYENGIFTAGKEFNTLETLANNNIIRWGRTCAGGWVDQTIFIDAISSDLQTAVYSLFLNSAKVPRDINGYAAIEAAIEGVIKSYQVADANGAYAITPYSKDSSGNQTGGYRITMPVPSDASDADKTGRVLNGAYAEVWYASPLNSMKLGLLIAL